MLVSVLDTSSASLHILLTPPVSCSSHCYSNQFSGGSDQFHSVCNRRALLPISACSFPSQASLQMQRWALPRTHLACMHVQPSEWGRNGSLVVKSQWVNECSPFLSLNSRFCAIFIQSLRLSIECSNQAPWQGPALLPIVFASAPPPSLLLSGARPGPELQEAGKHLHLSFASGSAP